jgi:hypothetical protein
VFPIRTTGDAHCTCTFSLMSLTKCTFVLKRSIFVLLARRYSIKAGLAYFRDLQWQNFHFQMVVMCCIIPRWTFLPYRHNSGSYKMKFLNHSYKETTCLRQFHQSKFSRWKFKVKRVIHYLFTNSILLYYNGIPFEIWMAIMTNPISLSGFIDSPCIEELLHNGATE